MKVNETDTQTGEDFPQFWSLLGCTELPKPSGISSSFHQVEIRTEANGSRVACGLGMCLEQLAWLLQLFSNDNLGLHRAEGWYHPHQGLEYQGSKRAYRWSSNAAKVSAWEVFDNTACISNQCCQKRDFIYHWSHQDDNTKPEGIIYGHPERNNLSSKTGVVKLLSITPPKRKTHT